MVNSTDIKDFTVQNEQDVVSDIQAQEEAEMAELEAKDAAVAAAAQAGIEPNRTVKNTIRNCQSCRYTARQYYCCC